MKEENKLNNWQKALIEELNDVLHDNFEDYETGIELKEETKLNIVNDMLDFPYQFWEDIRCLMINYIKENLTEEQLKILEEL